MEEFVTFVGAKADRAVPEGAGVGWDKWPPNWIVSASNQPSPPVAAWSGSSSQSMEPRAWRAVQAFTGGLDLRNEGGRGFGLLFRPMPSPARRHPVFTSPQRIPPRSRRQRWRGRRRNAGRELARARPTPPVLPPVQRPFVPCARLWQTWPEASGGEPPGVIEISAGPARRSSVFTQSGVPLPSVQARYLARQLPAEVLARRCCTCASAWTISSRLDAPSKPSSSARSSPTGCSPSTADRL